MDAGPTTGVAILADRLPARKHGVMILGPQNQAAKIAFEYFMWKMKNGCVAPMGLESSAGLTTRKLAIGTEANSRRASCASGAVLAGPRVRRPSIGEL
jgi:hypothetical protein